MEPLKWSDSILPTMMIVDVSGVLRSQRDLCDRIVHTKPLGQPKRAATARDNFAHEVMPFSRPLTGALGAHDYKDRWRGIMWLPRNAAKPKYAIVRPSRTG